MMFSKVLAGSWILLACAGSSGEPPMLRPVASGKDMLSGGGCFVQDCVAGRAALRLPCVSSRPSILAKSLKVKVEWHVGGSRDQQNFAFDFPVSEPPVSLALPLTSNCETEIDSIFLSAAAAGADASNPRRVGDVVNAQCASEPKCEG